MVSILCAIVVSCSISSSSQTGSVDITVNSSRSFSSDLDIEIATYEVSMKHQVTEETTDTITMSVSEYSPVSFTELMIGTWDIHVDAKNAGGTIIATGDNSIKVEANRTKNVNVQLSYLTGTGTLDLSLTWDKIVDGITASVVIVQNPIDITTQTPVVLTINEDNLSADLEQTLDSGTYMISAALSAEALFTTGKVEAFEIRRGATTQVEVGIKIPQGDSGIEITDPDSGFIPISFTGISDGAMLGPEALPLTITASADVPVLSWSWYLNGVLIDGETSDILVIDDIPMGAYSLTCVGIGTDGFGLESIDFLLSERKILGR